jgi:hypothetical protein
MRIVGEYLKEKATPSAGRFEDFLAEFLLSQTKVCDLLRERLVVDGSMRRVRDAAVGSLIVRWFRGICGFFGSSGG